ncbi:MAG: 50S ribosomal protein L11 methyltransferase [Hyphomicrobiales bacterium]
MSGPIWKLTLPGLPFALADRLSDLANGGGTADVLATALDIDDEPRALWRLEAYCASEAAARALLGVLDAAARRHGVERPDPSVTPVEDLDWVSKSQADLAPISAGRFFVHGSHDRARRPPNGVAIEVDAGQAFGTGHHGTTLGCLLALDDILKKVRPRKVLDLGCGSGILAIAAALAARCPVVAGDIDPVAVRVARRNVRLNAAGMHIRTVVAAGTRNGAIRDAAPYDIVFANILARPLAMLAPEIRSVLAPGGRAIVSGLTPDQEARVVNAYRLQGLPLERRSRHMGWSTLVLSRSVNAAFCLATRRSGCPRAPVRYR